MDLRDIKLTGKKEIIIRAALEMFCEKGFHNTKMEDIAERANIGKGTIYEYFRSKESLFENALRSGLEYIDNIVVKEVLLKSTSTEKLEAIIRGYINILFQFKHLAKLVSLDLFDNVGMDKCKFQKQDQPHFVERLEFVMDIIRNGVEQGEFRQIDPFTAAFSIISSVFGAAFRMLLYPNEEISEEAAAETAIRLIMDGIAAEAESGEPARSGRVSR
ncbi:MAG: TetR/AcrR family transcriptional regulator [Peptococcaceae bacterium]|jgi:TetR/AcrR family fatty acid metabolism transcriptional regulator|nr:TetR/AcrR family transcriptional regulator [Peptococcaceae bacterium]